MESTLGHRFNFCMGGITGMLASGMITMCKASGVAEHSSPRQAQALPFSSCLSLLRTWAIGKSTTSSLLPFPENKNGSGQNSPSGNI